MPWDAAFPGGPTAFCVIPLPRLSHLGPRQGFLSFIPSCRVSQSLRHAARHSRTIPVQITTWGDRCLPLGELLGLGMPPMPWGTPGGFPGLMDGAAWDEEMQAPCHQVLGCLLIHGGAKASRGGEHRQLSPHGQGAMPGLGWPGCGCHRASPGSALQQAGARAAEVQPTCDMLPYFLSRQGLPSCGVLCLPCRVPLGPLGPWQHEREHFWRCNACLPHQYVCVRALAQHRFRLPRHMREPALALVSFTLLHPKPPAIPGNPRRGARAAHG